MMPRLHKLPAAAFSLCGEVDRTIARLPEPLGEDTAELTRA